MNPEVRLLIDGQLVPAASGQTYVNVNPATEAIMGEVADAGLEDMDKAIDAARRAFDDTDWSTNHNFRLKCLEQLKHGLLTEMEDFKEQIAAETGAPMGICGASGPHCEIPIGFIDYSLKVNRLVKTETFSPHSKVQYQLVTLLKLDILKHTYLTK